MAKMVSLTIDGQPVTVSDGTLIVNAAKQAGIDIPVFCYHPKMEPVGMCRQCLVEIGRPVVDRASGQVVMESGQPKIQFGAKLETSCTTPVSEGMVVLTTSERAKAGQKEILEFLLSSHPLDCPICDKGGECPLQNLTMAYGPAESRFIYDEKHHAEKHVALGELIYLDRERCIQCARCIRFQETVAGEPVLAFYQRGRATDIITNSTPPFDSVFSGNTTDICPVGALTTADFRFGARPWELKASASVCAHCPVGCNISFSTRREAKSGGRVVIKRVVPRQNEQVNELWICDKGRFGYHFSESEDRVTRPSLRKDGKLRTTSWESALKQVAEKFTAARKDLVVLAGGRLSNEDLFNLKGLADGAGGKASLFTNMGGGELSGQLGVGAGTDFASTGPGTAILVVAADLYHEAPLWYLRVKQAAERGATLILAAARETKLEKYACHVVRYAYGDEAETIAGLLNSKPGKAVAEALTGAENLVVLYGSDGLGLEGTSALAGACASLLVASKHHGRPNNGLIGVWPRANDQGAWELGYRPEADLAKALKGKTVYIVAADPAGDDPALAAALKGAAFVVAQELFLTPTAELADVVLPAQAFTEREGTFTSGERRVQRFYPAVPVHGEARADFAIAAEIGKRLGVELEGRSPALVMDRIAAAVAPFAGISYSKLAEVSEQWPPVGGNDLYYGGTSYENRQGLGVQLALADLTAVPAAGKQAAALRPKEDQWLAVPVTRLYDRGITVFSSQLLHQRIGGPTAILHPETAKRLKLEAGAQVLVDGAAATLVLDETVPASVALVPRSMGLPVHAPAVVELKAGK